MPAVPSVKINHIFETEFVRGKNCFDISKKRTYQSSNETKINITK